MQLPYNRNIILYAIFKGKVFQPKKRVEEYIIPNDKILPNSNCLSFPNIFNLSMTNDLEIIPIPNAVLKKPNVSDPLSEIEFAITGINISEDPEKK